MPGVCFFREEARTSIGESMEQPARLGSRNSVLLS
jgi:hypothetical protein